MISKNIKLVVGALLMLLVGSALIWVAYSLYSSSKAIVTVQVVEKQGAINEEEASRSIKAITTGNSILTESSKSFSSRLRKYESSIGYTDTIRPEGVYHTQYNQREPNERGQSTGEEGEISTVLQGLGVLQEDATRLLCSGRVIRVMSEDGKVLVSEECLQ